MAVQLTVETATAAIVGVVGAALWKINPFVGAGMAAVAYLAHQVGMPAFQALLDLDDKKKTWQITVGELVIGLSWLASLSQLMQLGAQYRSHTLPLLNTFTIVSAGILVGNRLGEFIYKGATSS